MAFGRNKKKEYNYFEKMAELAEYSKLAAAKLVEFLNDYTDIEVQAEQIHDIEHDADEALHGIMSELNRTFITPIDREDIISISNRMDDVTDAIEDVANQLYMLSIVELHPETHRMGAYILEATSALYDSVVEFEKYKVSKNLHDLIVRVNRIETEGDKLYRTTIKSLFQNHQDDPIYIMKWKDVFDTMEHVLDCCEEAVTVLEGLAIKNS